jgi:hypothetical protein
LLQAFIKESCEGGWFWELTYGSCHYKNEQKSFSKIQNLLTNSWIKWLQSQTLIQTTCFCIKLLVLHRLSWDPWGKENVYYSFLSSPRLSYSVAIPKLLQTQTTSTLQNNKAVNLQHYLRHLSSYTIKIVMSFKQT